jgi:type II secretory pathway pseudopilin PulG
LAKSRFSNDSGFSLIETVVATGILATALISLAQLFALATESNTSARDTTYAAMLAEQKIEQLRALTWGFDSVGLPLSDTTTNTAVQPEEPTGGKGLTPSPADALKTNSLGYVDYVDQWGNILGTGESPQDGALYFRRWSIEPLPTNPNNTLIIQVVVGRIRDRGEADQSITMRARDEARIMTVKTRKAQ